VDSWVQLQQYLELLQPSIDISSHIQLHTHLWGSLHQVDLWPDFLQPVSLWSILHRDYLWPCHHFIQSGLWQLLESKIRTRFSWLPWNSLVGLNSWLIFLCASIKAPTVSVKNGSSFRLLGSFLVVVVGLLTDYCWMQLSYEEEFLFWVRVVLQQQGPFDMKVAEMCDLWSFNID